MFLLSESRRSHELPRYSFGRHCRTFVAAPGFSSMVAAAGLLAGYVWLR